MWPSRVPIDKFQEVIFARFTRSMTLAVPSTKVSEYFMQQDGTIG